ncbi:hypothetical protein KQI30_12990 [Clostridium bornimense]|uniref:hypothetical protein n=1 Tax=Clostridium bornimense TaxID=1216932 RepID=UPI001C104F9B|nr:hypothetical protein [Clostridium bornimense]MBU5317168.1 hypothetical protein [Clostridium bornimense]
MNFSVDKKVEATKSQGDKIYNIFSIANKVIRSAASVVKNTGKTVVTVGDSVKEAVTKVSKSVLNASNSITKNVEDVSENVTNKFTDTAKKVASTVKQVTATAESLKDTAEEIINSASNFVSTGVTTAVSVGKEVSSIVSVVGISSATIKGTIDSPDINVLGKVIRTAGIVKGAYESIDKSIRTISSSVSEGYVSMKNDYDNIVNNIEKSLSPINDMKTSIISTSKDVVDAVNFISDKVKTGANNIFDTVKVSYKDIGETVEKAFNESVSAVKEGYNNIRNDIDSIEEFDFNFQFA